jgi:hypothetical protein
MAYIFGKIKCYFCDQKKGVIHSVCDYGMYGEIGKRVFYHPECLEMVEVNPEKFSHTMMDKALHIYELREHNMKQYNNKLVESFNKKVETLHRNNFERMMPSKMK